MIQIALARPESYDFRPSPTHKRSVVPTDPNGKRRCTDHDTKYLIRLGQPGALVTLASRCRDHRHDRLWLVDEPRPGAPGPFFLSLDPCRYRLSRAAADGVPADLARPQPDPGLARGHAALATDGGEPQPLGALRRDHCWWRCLAGRIPAPARRTIRIGSGCFRFRRLPRPTGKRPRAYEDRHILFAYVLLALIVIHLGAALWHHFVRRDRVTARMIERRARTYERTSVSSLKRSSRQLSPNTRLKIVSTCLK